jgi:hypothetical protein
VLTRAWRKWIKTYQKAIAAAEKGFEKESAAKAKTLQREAAALQKTLEQRLALVQSGQPYLPRLSPKDFAIGQIGELDDDLILKMSPKGKDEARVGVLFDELQYDDTGLGGVPWLHVKVSRPDSFFVRGDLVPPLAEIKGERELADFTQRALRKRVFEIVEEIPRGAVSDFVLVPFEMEGVTPWLNAEKAKRPKK